VKCHLCIKSILSLMRAELCWSSEQWTENYVARIIPSQTEWELEVSMAGIQLRVLWGTIFNRSYFFYYPYLERNVRRCSDKRITSSDYPTNSSIPVYFQTDFTDNTPCSLIGDKVSENLLCDIPQDTFYSFRFETPLTWNAMFPYLRPPRHRVA
jgi:hypothetical protein